MNIPGASLIGCAALLLGSVAACTSPASTDQGPLARFTTAQMCRLIVAPGNHLTSVRRTTAAQAPGYLGLIAAPNLFGWGNPAPESRAAICIVRDRTGTTRYAINEYGGRLSAREGIVLLTR